eukprot:gene1021-3145_t
MLLARLPVYDARGMGTTLDDEGVRLVRHAYGHIDYYDRRAILEDYR